MPIKPKEAGKLQVTTSTMRGVDLLNVIRSQASLEYQNRVPVATQDNIEEVGNPILNFQATKNEFLSSLINRIALVLITNKSYNNPLKLFKKGTLSVGETIEEIFVNIIKAEPYYQVSTEGKTDCEDAFARRLPDVRAVFHTRNRQDKYVTTVSNDDLRAAFISYQGIEDLVSKIIEALYTSDEYDEFILMKHVFFEAGLRGALYPVAITKPTDESTAKKAMTTIRGAALKMRFMSETYNYMGVANNTPVEDQVIFILADFMATVDVEVLAVAFNMDKTDFLGRVIVVDDFGGLEAEGCVAILADKDWFMVFDNYLSMTELYNPARLYWNYFLHHWQTLSYSPFQNAVAFVTTAPVVSSVSVTPSTSQIVKSTGGEVKFAATVTGTGLISNAVTWSAVSAGGGDHEFTIGNDGLLTVIPNAAATTITVTATSKQDATKKATALVTISGGLINSVTISPKSASIGKVAGGTQQFTAVVDASGTADKTVAYLINKATASTATISSGGLLTVPANDPSTEIYITAHSTVDLTKSDTAVVTLTT